MKKEKISVILKWTVIISAIVGTILSALGGKKAFMGCIWWILLLLGFILLVGKLYMKLVEKKTGSGMSD